MQQAQASHRNKNKSSAGSVMPPATVSTNCANPATTAENAATSMASTTAARMGFRFFRPVTSFFQNSIESRMDPIMVMMNSGITII